MSINLEAFEKLTPKAVRAFWKSRSQSVREQKKRGRSDQGNRAGVTTGRNMDGFIGMVSRIVRDNGIDKTQIYTRGRANLSLPGYYRPMKQWDLLVIDKKKQYLVAAIEFKSQVGPSFGNNFNNRIEEAVGNAVDFNTAFRDNAFGESPKPFLGYFFVFEDCDESRRPVRFHSPHFPAFKDFENTSYAQRYEIFCRRLVRERLYDSAALLLTKREEAGQGIHASMSPLTSAERFAATLAGKAAVISAT